jgi:hypothetical protein
MVRFSPRVRARAGGSCVVGCHLGRAAQARNLTRDCGEALGIAAPRRDRPARLILGALTFRRADGYLVAHLSMRHPWSALS